MIQRWSDLTPEEQQRYTYAEQLRAQLAAAQTERDDYRSRFREMEREAELLRSQLIAMQLRAETAEARLLVLQVDRSKTVKLRDETDNVIWALKPDDVPGAINWGDLGCCEVQEVIDDERRWYRVIIEEADPSNPALHAAVTAGLVALGWPADDIEIETAW